MSGLCEIHLEPSDRSWVEVPRLPGPITLQICRESREETPEDYCFGWAPDYTFNFNYATGQWRCRFNQSVCFSAKRDHLIVHDGDLKSYWKPTLLRRHPNVLHPIEEIQIITDCYPCSSGGYEWADALQYYGSRNLFNSTNPRRLASAFISTPHFLHLLSEFPALKVLRILSHPADDSDFELFKDVVRRFLKLRKCHSREEFLSWW